MYVYKMQNLCMYTRCRLQSSCTAKLCFESFYLVCHTNRNEGGERSLFWFIPIKIFPSKERKSVTGCFPQVIRVGDFNKALVNLHTIRWYTYCDVIEPRELMTWYSQQTSLCDVGAKTLILRLFMNPTSFKHSRIGVQLPLQIGS